MICTRIAGLLVLSIAAAAVTVGAQSTQAIRPGAEHQKLAAFVGTWNTEGQAFTSPYGPAGKITGRETFAWLPGNFFLEHKWDSKQGTLPISGTEIMGYDTATKGYFSRFFDNFGNTGAIKTSLSGNTWTFTAESVVGGKPLKERGTATVTGDTMTNKWDYSTDGAKWLPNFEVKMTRVK